MWKRNKTNLCPASPGTQNKTVMDTPKEIVNELQPLRIKGLRVNVNGMIIIPARLYFGTGGKCYYHFGSALHPVCLENKQYEVPGLTNVCANYDGKIINNFYID